MKGLRATRFNVSDAARRGRPAGRREQQGQQQGPRDLGTERNGPASLALAPDGLRRGGIALRSMVFIERRARDTRPPSTPHTRLPLLPISSLLRSVYRRRTTESQRFHDSSRVHLSLSSLGSSVSPFLCIPLPEKKEKKKNPRLEEETRG